jgi:hypothetical protein
MIEVLFIFQSVTMREQSPCFPWVRITSNQGKLIQHVDADKTVASRPRGGTFWFPAVASQIRLEVMNNVENRRQGKLVAVRNSALEVEYTSQIVGTDTEGAAIQDPCLFDTAIEGELYCVSLVLSTSEMQAESIVLIGRSVTGLGPFGASNRAEYFGLLAVPHYGALIP